MLVHAVNVITGWFGAIFIAEEPARLIFREAELGTPDLVQQSLCTRASERCARSSTGRP